MRLWEGLGKGDKKRERGRREGWMFGEGLVRLVREKKKREGIGNILYYICRLGVFGD